MGLDEGVSSRVNLIDRSEGTDGGQRINGLEGYKMGDRGRRRNGWKLRDGLLTRSCFKISGEVFLREEEGIPTIYAINRRQAQGVLGVQGIAGREGTITDAVKEVGVVAEAVEVGSAVGIRGAVHVVGLSEHVPDACLLWFCVTC